MSLSPNLYRPWVLLFSGFASSSDESEAVASARGLHFLACRVRVFIFICLWLCWVLLRGELRREPLCCCRARALGRSLCGRGGTWARRGGWGFRAQAPQWCRRSPVGPSMWNLPRSGYGPRLLRWQEVSSPLGHQGSSGVVLLAFSLLWIVCPTADSFSYWILICKKLFVYYRS